MSAVPRYTWELVRGDDTARTFEYQDETGSPVDLTDYTANLEVTRAGVLTLHAATINEAEGKITVEIDDAVTATWASDATFKLRLTSPDDVLTTILVGDIEVIQ